MFKISYSNTSGDEVIQKHLLKSAINKRIKEHAKLTKNSEAILIRFRRRLISLS